MIHSMTQRWLGLLVTSLVLAGGLSAARACPFCTATSLTFTEEMYASDVAVLAKLVEKPENQDPLASAFGVEQTTAKFEVVDALRGAKVLGDRKVIETTYFGQADVGSMFLLMAVDPPKLSWSTPILVSKRAQKYLASLLKLPKEGPQRLEFFQEYLEDEDDLLARDAYDEFAAASFADLRKLKEKMDHGKLIGWIKNPEVPASRRRLYLTMLGVCGTQKDVPLLEEIIRSNDRAAKAGFDAVIGCYLTLTGEKGLKLIDELFLAHDEIEAIDPKTGQTEQRKVEYSDTYAAVQALRFHGQEQHAIKQPRIIQSLRLMLNRQKLADLIIPDLARWKDWETMERLVKMFKESDRETTWVRTPIMLYLRECPRPEAKKHLAELAKLDPEAFERASAFAPSADASPSSSPSSSSGDSTVTKPPAASDATQDKATSDDKKAAAVPLPRTKPPLATTPLATGAAQLAATRATTPASEPASTGIGWVVMVAVPVAVLAVLGLIVLPPLVRAGGRRQAARPGSRPSA